MSTKLFHVLAILALLFPYTSVSAPHTGEHVSLSGSVDDDLYLAGEQVDLYATVNGDVVVAGGRLNLAGQVREDVIAAGGEIDLRGVVGDDARVAGGYVRVLADIGDDLVAAGGRLQSGPKAVVSGSAWLAGGDVFVDGTVSEHLRASGGRVIVAGTVDGNADIWADRVEVRSGAVISGRLVYRSPHPAVIAEGARIDGGVTHMPVDVPVAPLVAGFLFAGLLLLLGLMLTGVALYLVFPGVAQGCSQTVRNAPWASLGYGLAIFAGGPVVIVLLLSTGLGIWLALLLLAVWLGLLLTGYLTGAYFVADAGFRKLNKEEAGMSVRAIALALSILILSIVNLIPLIGALVNWLVLLAGIGALNRLIVSAYRR